MFVIVTHHIDDPKRFWAIAERELANLPEGMKLHGSYPSEDGRTATCIWEAGSVPKLQDYLEGHVGQISDNAYMPVDASRAMGLPTSMKARTTPVG